ADQQTGIDFAAFQQLVRRVFTRVVTRIAAGQIDGERKPRLPTQHRISPRNVPRNAQPPRRESCETIQVSDQLQERLDVGMSNSSLGQSQSEKDNAVTAIPHPISKLLEEFP